MSTPIDITGIIRVDTKQTPQTSGQYNGQARPGELVVDLTTYELFIGNLTGDLNPFDNPLGSNKWQIINSTSNVSVTPNNGSVLFNVGGIANVLDVSFNNVTIKGNLIPGANAVYSLGNATNQLKNLWLSGTTLYMNGAAVTSVAGTLYLNGQQIVTAAGAALNTTVMNASLDISAGGNMSIADNAAITGTLTTTYDMVNNGLVSAVGNIDAGNLSTAGTLNSVSDMIVGGITATGNISGVNFSAANTLAITGAITASGVTYTDRLTGQTGGLSLFSIAPDQNITLDPHGTGAIDVSSSYITNVLNPINPSDLATKAYADSVVVPGFNTKDTVLVASTASLATLTSGTVTYNNGTGGVGATLTLSLPLVTLDGIPLTAGDRVLIKNETTTAYNGVYVYNSSLLLTRATDSDTAAELVSGSYYYVRTGATLAKQAFVINTGPTVVGTDPVVFLQVTGQGTVSAGSGLQMIGNTMSLVSSPVTAGTRGGGANTLVIDVSSKGLINSVANSLITGGIADLVVSNRLTVSNVTLLGSISGLGNITSNGTISGSDLIATRNLTLGNTSNISGNLITAGTAANITQNLRAGRMDVNTPYYLRYTERTTVNNILTTDGLTQLDLRGNTTFNRIASLGLINNISISGGSAGSTLVTNGGTNGSSWGVPGNFGTYLTNVSIGQANIGGQLWSNQAWGATSVFSPGSQTAPATWSMRTPGRLTGSAKALTNAGGTIIQLTNGLQQRGAMYAKPGWTKTDFLKRDNPLLFEATFQPWRKINMQGDGSGGFWIAMPVPDTSSQSSTQGLDNGTSGYPQSPMVGACFYVTSTKWDSLINLSGSSTFQNPTLCRWFLSSNGILASPFTWYQGRTKYDNDPPYPPPANYDTPLKDESYLQFSRSYLQSGEVPNWTLSMLYNFPSGSNSNPTIYCFLNYTLLAAFSWELYSRFDWIEGANYAYSSFTNYGGYYATAGAGSGNQSADQRLVRWQWGSGQAFMARYLGRDGTVYMPT